MSSMQGNASLMVDVGANTTSLGISLSAAERMLDQSVNRMAKQADTAFEKIANGIGRKLMAAMGAGLAMKVLDDALRKLAEGIRESQGAKQIGEAIGKSVVDGIRAIPIAGGLMDVASELGNLALGDPMGMDRSRENSRLMQLEQQRRAALAPGEMRELEIAGATGEIQERLLRQREAARLREIATRASAGRTQMVNDQEMELQPGFIEARESAINAALKKFDDEVAKRRSQEAQRIAEQAKREQERAAAEEERRLRAQEDAYDKFIEGNRREAILALESQLHQAGTAAAPTRAERLAGLMSGMGTGMATGETALGAFTFATGDAAEISRGILEKATSQLEALERIEAIQEEIRELQRGGGLN
jgi:hypothetical protein